MPDRISRHLLHRRFEDQISEVRTGASAKV